MNIISLLYPILLTVSSDKPIIADYRAVVAFDNIPNSALIKAASLRMMFRHASVGTTVNDGLDCLQGTRNNPSECQTYPQYQYDRRLWSFQPRGNSGWYGKIDDFVEQVDAHKNEYDVFAFKYCYLDGLDQVAEPCGKPYNSLRVSEAWDYLRHTMETLESQYPDKIFIWWTIPLTQVGQVCTDSLNKLIRDYVHQHNKFLFDIADIECHDPSGNMVTNAEGFQKALKEYCGEQNPDAQACHPNWTGKMLLAKALWWLMAEIANPELENISSHQTWTGKSIASYYQSSLLLDLPIVDSWFITLYNLAGAQILNISGDTKTVKLPDMIGDGIYWLLVKSDQQISLEKLLVINY
jgi:hypothetical protein